MPLTPEEMARMRTLNEVERKILRELSFRQRPADIRSTLGSEKYSLPQVQDMIAGVYEKLELNHVPSLGNQRREAAIRLYNDYMGVKPPTKEQPSGAAEVPERHSEAQFAPTAGVSERAAGEDAMKHPTLDEAFFYALIRRVNGLGQREREIVQLIANEKSIEEVLGVSKATAYSRAARVFEMLELDRSTYGLVLRQQLIRAMCTYIAKPTPHLLTIFVEQFRDKRAAVLGDTFAISAMRAATKIAELNATQLETLRVYLGGGDFDKHLKITTSAAMQRLAKVFNHLSLQKDNGLIVRNMIAKAALAIYDQEAASASSRLPESDSPATDAPPAEPAIEPLAVATVEATVEPVSTGTSVSEVITEPAVAPAPEVESKVVTPPLEPASTAVPSLSAQSVQSIGVAPSGPGVAITLHDPDSVAEWRILSRGGEPNGLAMEVADLRKRGFRPEVLVVYPTPDTHQSISLAVMVKRDP